MVVGFRAKKIKTTVKFKRVLKFIVISNFTKIDKKFNHLLEET